MKLHYSGWLQVRDHGESDDVLFLLNDDNPLADILAEHIGNRAVTARYWITDEKCARDEAQTEFANLIMGHADCKFQAWYSEYTGYLWTDEDINIGGHDLLAELQSHEGKWLILEIEVRDETTPATTYTGSQNT